MDGLDECLVPYDSPLKYQKGIYEGENLIRDEELGSLLDRVRKKLGKEGNLLVVLDACHSGTGLRGMANARGTQIVMSEQGHQPEGEEKIIEGNSVESQWAPNYPETASMIAFFSSAANQLNYEMIDEQGRRVGSLSYAFSKAFSNAGSSTSYRGVFEQIKMELVARVPLQQPQAEGDLDRLVMGGRLLRKTPYYLVDLERWISSGEIPLKGGRLLRLLPGTRVAFYGKDVAVPENHVPLATGVIEKAGMLYSIVKMDQPLSRRQAMKARVFVEEYDFEELRIRVRPQLDDTPLKRTFLDLAGRNPVLEIVPEEAPPELIVIQASSNSLRLLTADGYQVQTLDVGDNPEPTADQLVRAILDFAQGKFLRTLDVQHPQIELKLDIIPISKKPREYAGVPGSAFSVGDDIKFQVSNVGEVPAYYTLLDIQPNNLINVALPAATSSQRPEDHFIKPGETHLIETPFSIYPPSGTEVLKLIGSREPLYLSEIINQSRSETRGPKHPFEVLFEASYFYRSRGEQKELTLGSGGQYQYDCVLNLRVNSLVF